jgi:hypothetical protein
MRRSTLISLLLMLFSLVLAYSLDRWLFFQRRASGANFEFGPLIQVYLVSGLLMVASWSLLAWWTLRHGSRGYLSLLFVLVGLVVLVYPPLYVYSGLRSLLRLTRLIEYLPDSRLAYTGAFIAVLGLINWLMGRSDWRASTERDL